MVMEIIKSLFLFNLLIVNQLQTHTELPVTLNHFLNQMDKKYREQLERIPLFDVVKTATWTDFQKQSFAAIFYHIRGHFIDFMWYLANFAPDQCTKSILLNNISEELGEDNKFSHESLYQRFALECGVDIRQEIVNETHYLPFVRQFNKGHIRWLSEHDADERFSAFAAYERLDNVDYPYLTELASSINISSKGMSFFRVHTHVEHFSATLEKLIPIWESSSHKVEKAVNFIFSLQAHMWKQLSEAVFSL